MSVRSKKDERDVSECVNESAHIQRSRSPNGKKLVEGQMLILDTERRRLYASRVRNPGCRPKHTQIENRETGVKNLPLAKSTGSLPHRGVPGI